MDFTQLALIAALTVVGLLMLIGWLVVRLVRTKHSVNAVGKRRVEQSRAVLMGQVAEHFAPVLPGFDYHPKDARFIGQPVDYVIYEGLTEGAGELNIVFCEIKTGQSTLSATEKAIRQAVRSGRVRFEVLRILSDGSIKHES
jgi:predicted Holliday junction resolvase-like endonuclease